MAIGYGDGSEASQKAKKNAKERRKGKHGAGPPDSGTAAD
jgi:hypothetical protein